MYWLLGGEDSNVIDFAKLGFLGQEILVFPVFLEKVSDNPDFWEGFWNVSTNI